VAALFHELRPLVPRVKAFKFPRKSILNTFSVHTLERRRKGFAEFLTLLMDIVKVRAEWLCRGGVEGALSLLLSDPKAP